MLCKHKSIIDWKFIITPKNVANNGDVLAKIASRQLKELFSLF